jgi:putative hydrolase of the HAD superfamily
VRVEARSVSEVQERIAPHLVELLDEAGLEHGPTLSAAASRRFWTFTYTRFLQELDIDDDGLADRLYETFSSTSSYRLYDDVRPAFDELEESGYTLGLISNFDSWLQRMLVEMEVGHLFSTAVISGIDGIEKPDPAIYRLAADRAGIRPDRAVHVGDSPVMDIEPALTAGMHSILLDRTGRYPASDYPRITSLQELPPLVAKL